MRSDLAQRRADRIRRTMHDVREAITTGVDREALDRVCALLIDLGREKEMFGESEFPAPTARHPARLWLLSEDDGGANALYLISTLPLGPSPVHDHGTFAVIAGLEGEEENTLYQRVDDGSHPGHAHLVVERTVVLRDGDALGFMPQDIHHIECVSDRPTRHFHLYGQSFETVTGRHQFDVTAGTVTEGRGPGVPIDRSQRVC